ncbi:ProQ/FINO family protein [Vibrio owensii]|uniref:ProQ/FINO family protein n=1 Tax=Vibrio owensii TaxID=696485 RepID=UPI003CC57EE0
MKTTFFKNNKGDLSKRQRQIEATIKLLEKQFPQCFNFKRPKPLQMGIHQEIVEKTGLGAVRVKKALKYYTSRKQYYNCLRYLKPRFGLDGTPCGQKVESPHALEARSNFMQICSTKKETNR